MLIVNMLVKPLNFLSVIIKRLIPTMDQNDFTSDFIIIIKKIQCWNKTIHEVILHSLANVSFSILQVNVGVVSERSLKVKVCVKVGVSFLS